MVYHGIYAMVYPLWIQVLLSTASVACGQNIKWKTEETSNSYTLISAEYMNACAFLLLLAWDVNHSFVQYTYPAYATCPLVVW